VRFEEAAERVFTDVLTDLAEHPPYRLVNEIVSILEEELGDGEGGRVVTGANERQRRDHRYPSLPEDLRLRQPREGPAVARREGVRAGDGGRGEVHEVPVVHVRKMRDVELEALTTRFARHPSRTASRG
jgi:hypothetical protein